MTSITILEVPSIKDILLITFGVTKTPSIVTSNLEAIKELEGLEIDLSNVVSNAFYHYCVWASSIIEACTQSSTSRDMLLKWLHEELKDHAVGIPKESCCYNR